MIGGFQVGPFQLNFQQAASAAANSGGWLHYVRFEQEELRRRQRRALASERALEAQQEAKDNELQAELARRLHAELARQEQLDELQRLRLLVARHARLEGVPDVVQRAFERARAQQSFSRLQALQREFAKSLEEEEMALLMILLEEG